MPKTNIEQLSAKSSLDDFKEKAMEEIEKEFNHMAEEEFVCDYIANRELECDCILRDFKNFIDTKIDQAFSIVDEEEYIKGRNAGFVEASKKADEWIKNALQARNEEVVELAKKKVRFLEIECEGGEECYNESVGYNMAIDDIINLISPGSK